MMIIFVQFKLLQASQTFYNQSDNVEESSGCWAMIRYLVATFVAAAWVIRSEVTENFKRIIIFYFNIFKFYSSSLLYSFHTMTFIIKYYIENSKHRFIQSHIWSCAKTFLTVYIAHQFSWKMKIHEATNRKVFSHAFVLMGTNSYAKLLWFTRDVYVLFFIRFHHPIDTNVFCYKVARF